MRFKIFVGTSIDDCLKKYNLWYTTEAKKLLEASYKLLSCHTPTFKGYTPSGEEEWELKASWP